MTDVRVDRLRPGDHVCWAYSDGAERLRVLARFTATALAAGDRVLCHLDPPPPEGAVPAQGADLAAARARGQLRYTPPGESYLAGGAFDAEAVLDGWRAELAATRAAGYPGLRVITDMDWAARPVPGVEHLAWYEAQATRVFADGFATVVCLYDRRLFPRAVLDRAAAAHPGTALDDDRWRPQLRVLRTRDPVGVRLTGACDLSTRAALTAVLDGLAEDAPAGDVPLRVDVSGLRFADAAAAHALVGTARTAPAGVRVVGASPIVVKLLRLAGGRDTAGLTVVPAPGGPDHPQEPSR
jgi:anti-anti-sigma regulatory factor